MPDLTLLVTLDPLMPELKALERISGGTKVVMTLDPGEIRAAAPDADILLGNAGDAAPLLAAFVHSKRVRWIHSLMAGVEDVLSPEIVASAVPLTNARGVFKQPLGEWAVAAMLYFSYDLRRMIRNQDEGLWEKFEVEELHGRTLGIVGYGEIGRAVAERAKPFGMKIVAVRRRPELSTGDPLLDATYPLEKLNEMIAQCDYVAVAAPLTRETRRMIGEAQIGAMKPSAVLLNVGRGPVIHEAPLIRALESGKIRGAGLDVFENEPLRPNHPFYKMKNVLLSPHTADRTRGWLDRAVDLFLDNFERFRTNEPLQNVVDKNAGY